MATASSTAPARRDLFIPAVAVGYVICLLLLPVEIDTFTGIPAHPLLLHVPVIFVPLTALAAVAVAFHARWRAKYAHLIATGALVGLAGTVLAVGAGEKWRDSGEGGPGIAHHAELGEQTRIIVFVFVALLLVRLVLDRLEVNAAQVAATVLSVLVVASAIGSAVWVYRTGHAGAQQTFEERGEGGPPGGGFSGP